MSPPIQVPKERGSGAFGARGDRPATSSSAASSRLCSKNQRPWRISSTTRGRWGRTSSVCQRTISSAARSTTSSPASSSASSPPSRACAWRMVRRVASVGCAVRTSSSERAAPLERASSASLPPPRADVRTRRPATRAGRRPRARRPAASDPVVLLGDVDELEEEREGAQDLRLLVEVEVADFPREPARTRDRRFRAPAERAGSPPRAPAAPPPARP